MDLASFFPESKLLMLEDIREEISTISRIGTLLKAIILPENMLRKSYFKEVSMNDTAAILFSSGSEGSPKGVELSHSNLLQMQNRQLLNWVQLRVMLLCQHYQLSTLLVLQLQP